MTDLFGNTLTSELKVPHRFRQRKVRQSHYRAHIASICYPEITKSLKKTEGHNMPIIRPNLIIPEVVATTPFDRISATKSNKDSLVMFYINDDRFANRLSHPWSYTNELLQYRGVIAPDLSQYIDMDYTERMSNNYWNKVFAAYWQNQGVNIYPNVTWSLPDSYEYSLEGCPRNSVIAINSMGIKQSNFSISQWLDGYWYITKALKPICILRYGPKIYDENESISIYLDNEQIKFFEDGRKRK